MPNRFGLPKNRYFIWIFVISSVFLTSLVYVVYKQSRVLELHNQSVMHSYEVLRQSQRVLTYTLDMETGQRGYLLTGVADFLGPYKRAISQLDEQISSLYIITADSTVQQDNAAQIDEAAQKYKAILRQQINRYQHSSIRGLTLRDMQASRAAMEKVRKSVDNIIAHELERLDARSLESYRERKNYFTILFVGTALAIGGLLIANIIITALITRSRSTLEKLKEYEDLFETLMGGIDDGFYEYSPDTKRLLLSPSHEKMLGFPLSEMGPDAAQFQRLVHPDDMERTMQTAEQYFRHEIPSYSSEFRIRHRDGSYRWILSRAVGQWDKAGHIRRLIGTHTDITVQKEREEELRNVNHELEQFTYITSHDLRAPLVNLKGFAGEIELSLDTAKPALDRLMAKMSAEDRAILENNFYKDIPESLVFIKSAVEKMNTLTTAILDLSRIGRRVLRPETIDTGTIVQRCLNSLAYEIQQKKIEVETVPLPHVQADAVTLEQIFGNVLDNAVKYLDPKRAGKITISGMQLPGEVLFSIADNGRGIAESDKNRVFEIFRRAGNSGDTRGIGMGMAHVKLMVRRMGGRIWFESVLGEGTTFHFILPQQQEGETV